MLRFRLKPKVASASDVKEVEHILQMGGGVSVQHTPLVADGKGAFVCELPYTATGAVVRWFVNVEQGGVVAQECVAVGFWSVPSPQFRMLDIEGNVQALVNVSARDLPVMKGRRTPSITVPTQHIRAVEKAYRASGYEEDDILAQTAVLADGVHQVPLHFYTLLAQIRQPDCKDDAVWVHWLRVVRHLNPNADDAALLADLLSLVSLCWVYRSDHVRGRKEVVDTWSCLWSFPNPELAAFDCEDGSQALLSLIEWFQNLNTTNPDLVRLQTLAKSYTPYLAIGELLRSGKDPGEKDAYDLHCLVVMTSPTFPSITLESTAYASGVWRKDDTKDTVKVHRALPRDAFQRCSIPMARKLRMYRRLMALVTSTSDLTAHYVLPNHTDMASWLLDPKLPSPSVSLSSSSAAQEMIELFSILPGPRLDLFHKSPPTTTNLPPLPVTLRTRTHDPEKRIELGGGFVLGYC